MQSEFAFMGPSPLMELHRRLLKVYVVRHGPLEQWVQFDPVTQLVHAILDGRTREANAKQAFHALRARFHCWQSVLDSSVRELEQLLQPVMYAERKAGQIYQALAKILKLRGVLSLDFLSSWTVYDARAWLERLPGVGPKVSAAVVNFSTLRMPALVVDSHYQRGARRFGLVGFDVNGVAACKTLDRLVLQTMTTDDLQQHYFLVKRYGQIVCRRRFPNCSACSLRSICKTGRGADHGC